MPGIVVPFAFEGYGWTILQLIGLGPKFSVICGECFKIFRKRIRMVDDPIVRCPHCRTANRLPLEVEDE
jgi:hypothetical protein